MGFFVCHAIDISYGVCQGCMFCFVCTYGDRCDGVAIVGVAVGICHGSTCYNRAIPFDDSTKIFFRNLCPYFRGFLQIGAFSVQCERRRIIIAACPIHVDSAPCVPGGFQIICRYGCTVYLQRCIAAVLNGNRIQGQFDWCINVWIVPCQDPGFGVFIADDGHVLDCYSTVSDTKDMAFICAIPTVAGIDCILIPIQYDVVRQCYGCTAVAGILRIAHGNVVCQCNGSIAVVVLTLRLLCDTG